jgi:hypothetical protein
MLGHARTAMNRDAIVAMAVIVIEAALKLIKLVKKMKEIT